MAENKFYNRFNPYVCPAEDCGNSKSICKVKKWDEKREKLIDVGERDLNAEIQEAAKGTTIYEILKRQALGDPDAFAPEGDYLDVSSTPETSADAFALADSIPGLVARAAAEGQAGQKAEDEKKALEEKKAALSKSDKIAELQAQLDALKGEK